MSSSDSSDVDHDIVISRRPQKRRRLSVKSKNVSRRSSPAASSSTPVSAGANGGAENVPKSDPDTLKRIYSSCIDLFQAQKITVENAFQLKFLELMGQIIELPEFDKYDMLGAGRMLEAGAKIYVCRVEKTKNSVMDLASTLNMQQRNKNRKDADAEQDVNDDGEIDNDIDAENQEPEVVAKKKRRMQKFKEHRFIAENSKISLSVEVDSCKGGSRRTALKTKFQNFIENDMDFDYYNEYLSKKKVQLIRPIEVEEQQRCFGNAEFRVPTAFINLDQISHLPHLSFVLMENFDKKLYNVWGKLLHEQMEQNIPNTANEQAEGQEEGMQLQGEAEDHVYVPQGLPLADQDAGNDIFDDDRGFANDTFVNDDGMVEGTQEPAVNPKKLKTLQEFFDLYIHAKSQFAWCGPMFVKHHRFGAFNNGVAVPRRPRVKKDPIYIDVLNSNKKLVANKYQTNKSAKAVFDERAVERWSSEGRRARPYLETDEPDDDYEEVLELLEDEKPKIPALFKYFGDLRRYLFSNFNTAPSEDDAKIFDEFNQAEDDYIRDAGFEVDRHHDDDFVQEFHNTDGHDIDIPLTGENEAPFSSSFSFPISLGGLDSERESTAAATDADSLKFTRKPKPIDMHSLKRAIRKYLEDSLQFMRDGTPKLEEETKTDFISVVKYVFQNVDKKTVEHLSISIIVVGLLHVVVDKKLFLVKNPAQPVNPLIICRGSLWNHGDNIPMPIMIQDDD